MRIALVTDNLPSEKIGGGIGTYTVLVAEELARRGIEAHVFRWRSEGKYETYCTNGVTYHLCPKWVSARGSSLWQGAMCQIASRTKSSQTDALILRTFLGRVAAKTPFDLVEFPDIDGYAVSGIGVRGVKRVAVRLHGCSRLCRQFAGEPEDAPVTALDRLEIRAAQQADVLTSVSHSALAATRKVWNAELKGASVVPNPIAPMNETKVPRDPATVFFSGRLERRKGIDTLAEAIPKILRSCPDAKFIIFGKDTPWSDGRNGSDVLREILQKNNVGASQVQIMGAVPRETLLAFLQKATLAVVPSRYENQPFAVLESLACGTPLVVSDIPAHREIIEHEAAGRMFSCGDAGDLANQVIVLLSNPGFRATMSAAARERSRDFHTAPVVDSLLAAWGVSER